MEGTGAADKGTMVPKADSWPPEEGRAPHIPRDHLRHDTRRPEWGACTQLPAQDEIRKEGIREASDQGNEHQEPREHTRAAQGGRRNALRRLGDGPYRGQGSERHPYTRGKKQRPFPDGKAKAW